MHVGEFGSEGVLEVDPLRVSTTNLPYVFAFLPSAFCAAAPITEPPHTAEKEMFRDVKSPTKVSSWLRLVQESSLLAKRDECLHL